MDEHARILVVDDDESIRKTLVLILEDNGYIVDTVENGSEAIQKSNINFYNLALIDLRLPDMEGIKLLTAMKETTPRMVKIIITGYPSVQNAVAAVNRGADAYILKPLNIDDVLSVIKEHLKKQQAAKEYSQERVKEFIKTRIKELEEEKPVTSRKPL